jgi:hypothetical protein
MDLVDFIVGQLPAESVSQFKDPASYLQAGAMHMKRKQGDDGAILVFSSGRISEKPKN